MDPDALRREQLDEVERRAQAYVNSPAGGDIVDPSVITLNSAAVAMAMLDFQLSATGMFPPRTRLAQRIYHAPERALRDRQAAARQGCRWCDRHVAGGAFARGDDHPLPLRPGTPPRSEPARTAQSAFVACSTRPEVRVNRAWSAGWRRAR